jgi:predicted nucleotidyltransferase
MFQLVRMKKYKNQSILLPLKIGDIFPKKRDLLKKDFTMLKKESELLYLFALKPWQAYAESELKELYGTKSKSYVSLFIDKYIKNKVLKTEKIGKITVYSLNLDLVKARIYAGMTLEFVAWNKKYIPYSELQILLEKMPYANYVSLITGSYAKNIHKNDSDVDLVVIVEDGLEKKKIIAELKLQSELSIPEIHLQVFFNSEFIEMLKNKEANFGKELVKNCLVLSQGQTYLWLIDEAIKNGFDGKALYQQSGK